METRRQSEIGYVFLVVIFFDAESTNIGEKEQKKPTRARIITPQCTPHFRPLRSH